ncbi:DNA-formamidopyrimidine glycosylase, partial [Candidatus Uhrbacteria bacterium]|nr:DNA-formamidopyrimidine glycosylase [Candidatus Uhrbacteria bacterium]
MPELPEVETVRRQLEGEIVGLKIIGAEVRFGGRMDTKPSVFVRRVTGARVVGV